MRKPGLSLIELLITLSVSVILLTIFLPAFRTFEEKNNLQQAAQEVRSAIIRAQGFAFAPRQSSSKINCYKVTFSRTQSAYNVMEVTNAAALAGKPCGQPNAQTQETVVERYSLGPSVKIMTLSDSVDSADSCSFEFGVGETVSYGASCTRALGNAITVQLRNSRVNESTDAAIGKADDAFVEFNRASGTVTIREGQSN